MAGPCLGASPASLANLLALLTCVQDPEQLQESANQILTAIIQGMRKEEPSNNVKLAATNALLNSLEFTKANFDKEVGRSRSRAGPVCQPALPPSQCVCVCVCSRRSATSSCRWCVRPPSVRTPG